MASDFEYTGMANHQAGFRERTTGTQFWVMVDDESPVELRDGDEVVIVSGGQRIVWSIREQRNLGYA